MPTSQITTRVKVLYEIAMAIGNTLDERELLSDVFKVVLRKLNGTGIFFYDLASEQVTLSLPRRGMKEGYISEFKNTIAEIEVHAVSSGFITSWTNSDGALQFLFKINQVGWLNLITTKEIDAVTLSSLGPICDKLATSLLSCRTNQQSVQQEQDLQVALYNLKKAHQARDSFLANMSHEIRTPLNGILGFLHQLEETNLTPEQHEYLSIVKNSSDTLVGIINDILDFSKMDAGKLSLELEPFNVLDTITPVIELFRGKASQQNTRLEFYQEGPVPAKIKGDALRLKQVVSNLVSNAIKFSADETVTVMLIAAKARHAEQIKLTIKIKDTGIGIAPDKLKILGEPFQQAETSTSRNFGGTGLGLAICKGLLSLMQSELQIESTLGEGSCFYFSWDAQMIEETDSSSAQAETSEPTIQYPDKRVLLVEDNKVNQMLMQAILNKMQIKPDLAENGKTAVEKYRAEKGYYDLVLMDINMPVMDGIEATQVIREHEASHAMKATPIIALTANVLRDDRERYLAQQMDEVLGKPLNLDELNKVLALFFANNKEE